MRVLRLNEDMDRLEDISQVYSSAPWRKQLQMIGLFALILVFVVLIAGVFLNVSARAATVGREIQSMQDDIAILDLEIEDMESQLAQILSANEMESRAYSLGFEPVGTNQILYITVPGYVERQPATLAPYSARAIVSAPVVPREYTESLFEWFQKKIMRLSIKLVEVQP
jgi:cell division protein FtsL